MKTNVKLERDKGMKEADVRAAAERTAARIRAMEQAQGKPDRGQEAVRREVEKFAEQDRQRGKI